MSCRRVEPDDTRWNWGRCQILHYCHGNTNPVRVGSGSRKLVAADPPKHFDCDQAAGGRIVAILGAADEPSGAMTVSAGKRVKANGGIDKYHGTPRPDLMRDKSRFQSTATPRSVRMRLRLFRRTGFRKTWSTNPRVVFIPATGFPRFTSFSSYTIFVRFMTISLRPKRHERQCIGVYRARAAEFASPEFPGVLKFYDGAGASHGRGSNNVIFDTVPTGQTDSSLSGQVCLTFCLTLVILGRRQTEGWLNAARKYS